MSIRILLTAVAAVPILLFSGCTPNYNRLVREASVPDLAALAAAARLDQARTYFIPTTRGGTEPVIHLAVHEIDSPREGGAETTLVFLHGVMADHTTWRFIAGDLSQDFNLILIDFPGAGDSDIPSPRRLQRDGFSPSATAERTLEALRHRLEARKEGGRDERVVLVGHSLGGGVALRMWCDDEVRTRYEDVLARFNSMVLISPLDVAMPVPHPVFRQLAGAGDLRYDAASALGVMREHVAIATFGSVVEPERALREEADKRLEFLMDIDRRRIVQATLLQAIPLKGERPDWDEIERLTDGYQYIDVPALLLWGTRDETLPLSMGYKLAAELPRATLEILPRVRHSPHMENPELVAQHIRTFLKANGQGP